MFKSKYFDLFVIILIILTTVKSVKKFTNTEHFGYIPRVSQVTYRRKRHQGWGESSRSG